MDKIFEIEYLAKINKFSNLPELCPEELQRLKKITPTNIHGALRNEPISNPAHDDTKKSD